MKPEPANPAAPLGVEELRSNLQRARLEPDRLDAFAAVLFHKDAAWSDILAGLDESPAIAEVAAVWLHVQLNVPHRGTPILDKNVWHDLLTRSGRSPHDRVDGLL